jgi:hypothetical protein
MDSEQGSSEDSDSEATAPDESRVIATIDMDRMLSTEVSWVCLGKNKENGMYELMIPDGDWNDVDMLTGFVHRVCNPQFILNSIARHQAEGDDNGR